MYEFECHSNEVNDCAYIKPENFVFTLSLFLAITNMDKVKKIDVRHLSISKCT